MNHQHKWDILTTTKSFDLGIPDNNSINDYTINSSNQIELMNTAATTPISLLIQSLVQQLCSLLEKDQKRANILYNSICSKLHSMKLIDDSYSMGEFEAMRSQYQRALHHLVSVSKGSEIPITIPTTWPIVQPSGLEWSRYHREFEELYYIAGGGFGHVFKARHRLDGVEYAVKKIYIRSKDINSVMHHLAEVKTIASLNHINIVNYKAAWLEPMIEGSINNKTILKNFDTESEEFTKYRKNYKTESLITPFVQSFKTHNSRDLFTDSENLSDFVISFEHSDGVMENDEDSDDVVFNDMMSDDRKQLDNNNMLCKMIKSEEFINCSRVNLDWATLFIQMSYCQQTLKHWLDDRNKQGQIVRKTSIDLGIEHSDSLSSLSSSPTTDGSHYPITTIHIDVIIDMFTQLVRGLHYIHSRGIIHHDIKPSNIFVATTENGIQIQLGDFGLACPLQKSHNGVALGTHVYAAPEQLEGECNPKSDMYSLGIILLEMMETFSTDMERIKTITALRKGQIPAQLTANFPKIAHIIGKLVQRRPSKRLDTSQLLDELKQLSENKDEVIKTLKEELAAKNDEIIKLKLMLAKFNLENH